MSKGAEWKEGLQAVTLAEQDELMLSHLWIVRSVAHSLKKHLLFSADWDELISAGNLALVKAGRRYEARNGCQFRTYAYKFIRGDMLKSFTRIDGHHNSGFIEFVPLREVICSPTQESIVYRHETSKRLLSEVKDLLPRQRRVIEAYLDERPIAKVAREWGYKRDRVVKWQRIAIKQLRAALN